MGDPQVGLSPGCQGPLGLVGVTQEVYNLLRRVSSTGFWPSVDAAVSSGGCFLRRPTRLPTIMTFYKHSGKKKTTLYPLFTVTLPFVPLKLLVGLHWISAVLFNVTLLPVSLDGSSVFSFADQCSLRQIQANSLQFNKLLILNWLFLWESDIFVGQKHGSTFCERFLLSFITFQQPLKAWCPLNPLIQNAIRLFVCTHLVPWMNWNGSFFGQINSYMIIETLVEGLLPFNGELVVIKKFQSSQINGGISYIVLSERPTGCCKLSRGLTVLQVAMPSLAVAVDAAEPPSESPWLDQPWLTSQTGVSLTFPDLQRDRGSLIRYHLANSTAEANAHTAAFWKRCSCRVVRTGRLKHWTHLQPQWQQRGSR